MEMQKISEKMSTMSCSSCGKQHLRWPKDKVVMPSLDMIENFGLWLDNIKITCRRCRQASIAFSADFREALYETTSRFDVPTMVRDETKTSDIENEISSKLNNSSEFPSLSQTHISTPINVLQPRVKSRSKHKQHQSSSPKRRIRPAILTQTAFHVSAGNISSLPSEDPIESLTSNKCDTPRRPTSQVPPKSNVWISTTVCRDKEESSSLPSKKNKEKRLVCNKETTNCELNYDLSNSLQDLKALQHLACLYAKLFHQRIIPCYATEFAYIIRLLSCCHQSSCSGDEDWLHQVFHDYKLVTFFATKVIKEIEDSVVDLNFHLLKLFEYHPNLCKFCPWLIERVENILNLEKKRYVDDGDLIGYTRESLISLPFQSERDSRNNFQTSKLSRLYSNRESGRDSFLRLLRKFQSSKNHFGRKMEICDELQTRSLDMLRSLDPTNMFWFAEFFSDMLLQIGLNMHETDAEILERVTDKEKLQKLHRRFSSKEGKLHKKNHKNNGSSQKHFLKSPAYIHPENIFPGNQEFFWLFLISCDSYQFSMHLSRRFAVELSKLSFDKDMSGLTIRISKSRLLAKFLGFIVFSPFWNTELQMDYEKRIDDNNSMPHLNKDLLEHANSVQSLIPVQFLIEKAYQENSLLSVIPWVCEFLSMMKWDSFKHFQSSQYASAVGMLSWIYIESNKKGENSNTNYRSNMMLVSMIIERLLDETFGWNKSFSLDLYKPEKVHNSPDKVTDLPIDYYHFSVNKKFLFEIIPSLDDLEKALLYQHSKTLTGTIKKMRPHIVSSMQQSSHHIFPPSPSRRLAKMKGPSPESSIQDRLVAAFFHQHKDLEKIANFIADTVVQKFSLNKAKRYITQAINSEVESSCILSCNPILESFDLSKWSVLIQNIKESAKTSAKEALKTQCEIDVESAMTVLVADIDKLVKDVATKLTIQHAIKKGNILIDSLINQVETKRLLDQQLTSKCKDTLKLKVHHI